LDTFEYKKFDIKKTKTYFKNAFRLMFRRPIYSFLPFLSLTVILYFFYGFSFELGLISMLTFSVTLVPLMALDFSYSNDFSKIPFKSIKYNELHIVKDFFIAIFVPLFRYIVLFLVIIFIGEVYEFFFPPEVLSQEVIKEKEQVKSSNILFVLFAIIITAALTILSFLGYAIVFSFNLISLPTLLKSVPQENELNLLFDNSIKDNVVEFIKIFGVLSFIQALLFIFLPMPFSLLSWALTTSFGISLCYVITKDMSGGEDGLKNKESLFNTLFKGNKELSTSQ
jgi:hypothetical protein